MAQKKSRVTISKTPTEWRMIDDKLAQLRRANLNSYLRGKISLLCKDYRRSHQQVCQSLERLEKKCEYIDRDDLKVLELISVKTGMPIAQIINQLILNPLLRTDDDKST